MNQRQYLLTSEQAYQNMVVTPEFIACFGPIYTDPEEGSKPIESPTLEQYVEGLGFPGGKPAKVLANGVRMVITPIPEDRVLGDTALERYDLFAAAKESLNPLFQAEGTDWAMRWLGEASARAYIEANERIIEDEG